ncbi:curved DNA-binding protein [Pseudomonas cuatrocienegasensis]|uniref:Curved DNA-binding protein n=1 Tax=Pseudomonas cuatrocienegasensis TaxID=543360 RepID=A0ABY1BFT9_9PSED|nr:MULTISPECIES: DnaJ C-terminal domain-containing protein [Pseudomonas]OEC35900.1 DNA-binding protein [Pseudomonas sp. 21C1]SEQ75206.1 curved DNA-binding protein [Pseudomonas cuatrocienegasensis]
MDFKDYYKVLGLEPGADDKAVKTAYRKLARKYHPDVSKEADAENKFKEVAEAYEVLKSTETRAEYDELRKHAEYGRPFEPPPGWQPPGNAGYSSGGNSNREFSDFFESIFAGAGRAHDAGSSSARRGQDIEMALPLLLEETLSDDTKTIAFQLLQYSPDGQPLPAISKTLNVKIPAGVSHGERIRLKGQGAPGLGGGANGDLYLLIQLVPHPLFDVEAHNLIITVPLAPWEAALGSQVTLPTLNGKINLRVPANTQAGQRLRIKGKGLRNKSGEPGDLYALFKIVIPAETDEPVRALWAQLAEQAAFNPRAQWSQ